MTSTQPPDPQARRCGAHCRTTGQPCRLPPVMGRTRCRMHGGRTPRGPGLPQYRHGRYSQALPQALRSRYELALTDPERLSLADDVAVAEARIDELLQRLQAGGDVVGALREALVRAREAFRRLREANRREDAEAVRASALQLGQLLEQESAELLTRAAAAERIWPEVFRAQTHKRKLVEAEHRRALALAQMLTLEQAHALFGALTELVSTHVSDPRERRAIADGLVRLVGPGAEQPTPGR